MSLIHKIVLRLCPFLKFQSTQFQYGNSTFEDLRKTAWTSTTTSLMSLGPESNYHIFVDKPLSLLPSLGLKWVPASGQCVTVSLVGKVTVGLALHQPWIADIVVCPCACSVPIQQSASRTLRYGLWHPLHFLPDNPDDCWRVFRVGASVRTRRASTCILHSISRSNCYRTDATISSWETWISCSASSLCRRRQPFIHSYVHVTKVDVFLLLYDQQFCCIYPRTKVTVRSFQTCVVSRTFQKIISVFSAFH